MMRLFRFLTLGTAFLVPIIARFTLRSRVLAALLLCLCAALFY